MSQSGSSAVELTPLQHALLTITKLQSKLAAATRSDNEAIAIIGMGCRLPGGVDSPDRLRDLLWDAREAVSEIPAGRRALQGIYDPDPAKPGKMTMRRAGFVDDVDLFDAEFFHITRREAEGMDPQQRLFLEVSWEALESAGISPDRLAGTRTAVFAGVHAKDYASAGAPGLEKIGPHYSTGVDASYVAGRLAYFLGLEGTTMAVDTACSSSLVAVHLACQSLRSDESTLAIVGGVKLILSPHLSVFLSKAGALSPDGHCRAFDAAADGMVQGEGCGVVILKRLRDAQRDGDQILATIRGSAVNHNGASGGLTVPNPRAQEALYRLAIQQAKVDPRDVDYLEAHGTGTRLGDPIELQGVARVYGVARPADRPLWIGSSKTNLGHTEAAAGVTGLLKAVLVLQAGEVPASLHFAEPTPGFSWNGSAIEVARERVALRGPTRPHLAAVSSFGMSGVNAHMIVEAHRATARQALGEAPYVLVLSARGDTALRQLAARYERLFADAQSAALCYDRCFTAGAGRAHHDERLAIVARTSEELCSLLRVAAEGREIPGMFRARVKTSKKIASAFVFRAGPTPLGDEARLRAQVTLTELWRSYGVEPAAVIGHGAGEIAAAVVAGLLSLEEAAQLVASVAPPLPGVGGSRQATLPFFSVAAGRWFEPGDTLPLDHWARHGRSPGSLVAIGDAAMEKKLEVFLEIDSHPSIGADIAVDIKVAARRWGREVSVVSSVVPGGDSRFQILSSVGQLYCAGLPIRFECVYPGARKTGLPTYPWQRERYWWDELPEPTKADGAAEAPAAATPVIQQSADDSALDGLFQDIEWKEDGPISGASAVDGTWLVIADQPAAAAEVAKGLSAAGGTVVVASFGPRFEKLPSGNYQLDFTDRGSFVRLLRDLSPTGQGGVGIVVWACSGTPDTLESLRGKVHGDSLAVTSLVQAAAQVGWLKAPRLYLVTRGAQAVTGHPGPASIAEAPLWGLGRVIAYEHPELRCMRIDLDLAAGARPALDFLGVIGARTAASDDEIACRGGLLYTPSLTQVRPASGSTGQLRLRHDRSYLITGGLGGIGLRLAAWLVARGARHLALCGRKAESDEARQVLDGLKAAGVRVETFRVDISRPESLGNALGEIRRELPPIAGVFHCAGVLDDGSLLQVKPQSFATVMGPKVDGTWNLHTLIIEPSVELFVLFSSTASMIGAPGQANYAAANSFLDAMADFRRMRGQPAVSLNWGSWGEVGMAASDARRGERLADRGMSPMSVEQALAAMEIALLDEGRPAARGISALDPERWCRSHPTVAASSLFRRLLAGRAASVEVKPPTRLRDALLALEGDARRRALEAHLKEIVSEVSLVAPERLSVKDPFVTIGIDSMMSLELRDLVTARLEVSLPLMSFVDESTIEHLTNELLEQLVAASVLGSRPTDGDESNRILI